MIKKTRFGQIISVIGNMNKDIELFNNLVKGGVLGFVVGDALGVPGEFMSREQLAADPITDMRGGGFHEQPAGTWSDDTSMTLCTMQSLIENGVDYDDQMRRFEDWLWRATNTARDEVFDVGGATKSAIFDFVKGTPALECGNDADYSCGNGSLMRMLPVALYIIGRYGNTRLDDRAAEIIHKSSMCTHANKRCLMSCGIYSSVVFQLCSGEYLYEAVKNGIRSALKYYRSRTEFAVVSSDFEGIENIEKWSEDQISGSGYVVHTLQAALWCLMTTSGYAECVLKAANLGEDTDTTAAVAGSPAGLWYKSNTIPVNWLMTIPKRQEIEKLSKRFALACLEMN